MWGALSAERSALSFTIAAGPRQRSHSQVWVPWDSRPYFTVSDSRLPFLLPPTTCRATHRIQVNSKKVKVKVMFAVCWCGVLSLMREWVCCLQLLLGLASTVIFGSKSRSTRDHILLSQIWAILGSLLYSFGADPTENTAPNNLLLLWVVA
jgi:hypothetical protein